MQRECEFFVCWYTLPHWGFCPPGTGEICRRPTDQREVNEGGVKTIEGRGEAIPSFADTPQQAGGRYIR